jgi:hypothetical protein
VVGVAFRVRILLEEVDFRDNLTRAWREGGLAGETLVNVKSRLPRDPDRIWYRLSSPFHGNGPRV